MDKDLKFIELEFILDIISNFQKDYYSDLKNEMKLKYSDNDIYDILDELTENIIEATTDILEEG